MAATFISVVACKDQGERVSSVETARRFSSPFRIAGVVQKGFGRGSAKLGVPTANIAASDQVDSALVERDIGNGVYFGFARVDGVTDNWDPAVVNIGVNPTFGDLDKRLVEAHIIRELPQHFYGQTLELSLGGFLRSEQKFETFPLLVSNIKNDIQVAVTLLEQPESDAIRPK